MDYGAMLEAYFKGIVIIITVFFIVIITAAVGITHAVTKKTYSKEAIEQKEKYEKTLNELTPEQREILGL
jgi:flagellar basal body-associated protein FliL